MTTLLREPHARGTTSATKFVPLEYLLNSPDVRLAVLQGLLDTDGGPVTQAKRELPHPLHDVLARSCTTMSCSWSGRWGASPTAGAARRGPCARTCRGRAVHHRLDSYVLDIRLPEGIQPFRLMRKAAKYRVRRRASRCGYIERIETAGEAETVCIQVAAADSLYVTDDFLVTHNTLNSSFIILDEAQNTTPEQMKMFLTRIGFGSRAVVTGDTTQVDVAGGRSGLGGLERILAGIDGLGFVHLTSRDVVRHRIVQDIVDAYERAHAEPTSDGGAPEVDQPDPDDLRGARAGDCHPCRCRTASADRHRGGGRGVRGRRAARHPVDGARWVDARQRVLRRRACTATPSCRCCSSTRR